MVVNDVFYSRRVREGKRGVGGEGEWRWVGGGEIRGNGFLKSV